MHLPQTKNWTRRQLFAVTFTMISLRPGLLCAQERPALLDTMRVEVSSRTGAVGARMRSVTIVSRDEIDRTAACTLGDIIAPYTGVDVRARSAASSDVALRGASSEGVIVLVDGIRVSDQQTGHFDLDLAVPLSMIDHVEILRGTSSAMYGADAVGGVINIVTRGRRSASSSLQIGGGTFGTTSASFDASSNGAAGAIEFAKSDGSRPGTDYNATQARASLSGNTLNGIVRVDAGMGVRHFGAADFYGAYPAYEDTRSATASVSYDVGINSQWSLSTRADTRRHGDLFTLYRTNPAAYQNEHTSWQSGLEVIAHGQPSDMFAVAIGADAHDLQLTSARLGDHTTSRSALFSEVTLGKAGQASVDLGARADWSSDDTPFVSPSIAAMLPVGNINFRASAARGFREPTWTEKYYKDPANIGDSTLTAETFWSAEVGASAALSSRVLLDGAFFWRDANHLIDWTKPSTAADAVPWHTMNVERASYRGVEADGTYRDLFSADWTVRASALSFDPSAATGFRGKYALSPITSLIGISPTFHFSDLRFGVDAIRSRRANELQQTLVGARVIAPVSIAQVKVDLFNIGNASYRDVSGAPIPGRAVQVALNWRL